jgi:predicted site-specific integrase-resolvase
MEIVTKKKYYSIGEVSLILGISTKTLRRWDKLNKFIPESRTFGKHRRYSIHQIKKYINPEYKETNQKNVIYSRVSSHGQKDDLIRQEKSLMKYCKKNKIENVLSIKDLGSGINFKKKGLKKLINMIINSEIDTIFLTYKDRLLRFGSELIFSICEEFNTKVVIINQEKVVSFEETFSKDLIEIVTVYSSKLYGRRSHKNKKLTNS